MSKTIRAHGNRKSWMIRQRKKRVHRKKRREARDRERKCIWGHPPRMEVSGFSGQCSGKSSDPGVLNTEH